MGNNVRFYRELAGLSQEELAAFLSKSLKRDFHQTQVSKLEDELEFYKDRSQRIAEEANVTKYEVAILLEMVINILVLYLL